MRLFLIALYGVMFIQYGGGYGIYGPYGRPPRSGYDYPPGVYIPPGMRPRIDRPRGPDPRACIYYGNCGPQRPYYEPY